MTPVEPLGAPMTPVELADTPMTPGEPEGNDDLYPDCLPSPSAGHQANLNQRLRECFHSLPTTSFSGPKVHSGAQTKPSLMGGVQEPGTALN